MGRVAEVKASVTDAKKKMALEGYVKFGTVTGACRHAKINRTTFYAWIDKDPKFADGHRFARDEVADLMEEEAIERAYDGDHTLLIFLLKGLKPHKYGDRQSVEHTIKGPIVIRRGT